MPVDSSIFSNQKTFADYQRAQEEFDLRKAESARQQQLVDAQLNKTKEIDIDKLGEMAFIKASQGVELTPTETAALNYIDSKQQTMMFNPVTGNMEQKPSLLQRAGVSYPAARQRQTTAQTDFRKAAPSAGKSAASSTHDYSASAAPASAVIAQNQINDWESEYRQQLAAASGNPRLQQQIKETYAKSRLEMNENQSKSATYADRMALDEAAFNNPELAKSYGSLGEKLLDFANPFGDQLNSSSYRRYNQAQKDFSTAKLRQESGAVISPTEFETDKAILYPQVGDTPEILAQKKATRESVAAGMRRSAGPAYRPPVIPNQSAAPPSVGKAKLAPDGNYYLPDPNRPGKYLMVK